MVKVKEWEVEEGELIRLFRMFIPYREKHGLALGFELFFEDHTDFCLESGLDAVETTLLHNWKGKLSYHNGRLGRHIKREHTPEEWEQKKREFRFKCAYCGIIPEKLTKDHIIPIKKGGSDKIENIIPACQSCNSKKYTKSIRQFSR